MNIRPARIEDAHAIACVHVSSWQAAYPGLLPQDYLDGLDVSERRGFWERVLGAKAPPRAGTLVAELDRDIVGFANLGPTRDDDEDAATVGEISAIYVLPGAWRQGAGRELMTAALDALAEEGFEQATLWVLETNTRARRFYESGGWRKDGAAQRRELRGVSLTEVRYRRPLPAAPRAGSG